MLNHGPYLQSFNEQTGAELSGICDHLSRTDGRLFRKIRTGIPEGAVVAIADNPSNASRGLLLLQAADYC